MVSIQTSVGIKVPALQISVSTICHQTSSSHLFLKVKTCRGERNRNNEKKRGSKKQNGVS